MTDINQRVQKVFNQGVSTANEANALIVELWNEVERLRAFEPNKKSEGKWGMSRLWRAWMSATAEYMAGRGAVMPVVVQLDGTYTETRAFNEHDAHELFTIRWLGTDEHGKRLSWARKPADGETVADKGQRFHALQQHEAWMTDRGIKFINPRESEFASLCAMADGMN